MDHPPKSRNEDLASLMKDFDIVRKVVLELIELY